MNKKILIALALLANGVMHAQTTGQYLFLNGGGGLHTLSYDLQSSENSRKNGLGYQLNAGYGFFWNRHWGATAGLGLQSFQSASVLNSGDVSTVTNSYGSYAFQTDYNQWKETQKLLFLDIPLALQYRYGLSQQYSLLASAGTRISFPVKSTYRVTAGSFSTTAYFSDMNGTVSQLPVYDLDTHSNRPDGNYDAKPTVFATADLGVVRQLSSKLDLYVGGYFNYGVNNSLKSVDQLVYTPHATGSGAGVYNGVFSSSEVKTVHPISVGVKVGLFFALGNSQPLGKNVRKKPVVDTVRVLLTDKSRIDTVVKVIVQKPSSKDTISKDVIYSLAAGLAQSLQFNFPLGSAQPLNLENEKLKDLSQLMIANRDIVLQITGNTCDLGSKTVNAKLSQARALYVKKRLVDLGVDEKQLQVQAQSASNPVLPNSNEQYRAKNRRTEVRVK